MNDETTATQLHQYLLRHRRDMHVQCTCRCIKHTDTQTDRRTDTFCMAGAGVESSKAANTSSDGVPEPVSLEPRERWLPEEGILSLCRMGAGTSAGAGGGVGSGIMGGAA